MTRFKLTLKPKSEESVIETDLLSAVPQNISIAEDIVTNNDLQSGEPNIEDERVLDTNGSLDGRDTLFANVILGSVAGAAPAVEAKMLDGAAIVQMLAPKLATTFEDYVDNVFLPYILKQLENTERVDVVFDRYVPDSLKTSTREKRGSGVRRKVSPSTRIPGNWQGFLRVDENKTELFKYIADRVTDKIDTHEKVVVCTYDETVLTVPDTKDISRLSP